MKTRAVLLALAVVSSSATPPAPPLPYPWLSAAPDPAQTVQVRFPVPAGCRRVPLAAGSWGAWLRGLPLRPAGTPARLFDGRLKSPQSVVAAVVNIDIGTRDLQQCADAVMRLRAEYLFGLNANQIHFHLAAGYDARFSDFVAGRTFRVKGSEVLVAAKPAEAPTHAALMRYLWPVFDYANSRSLTRDVYVVPVAEAQPGDVLLRGGAPGHAVLVVDAAINERTGQRYLLLAQSYMPAQNIHVLRNVEQPALGAWYAVPGPDATEFDTAEYTFTVGELRRFE